MPALLPSELPVRCRTRHHWVALVALPGRWFALLLAALLIAAVIAPMPMAWVLGAVVLLVAVLRWQTWRAEQVILTGKRIIRVQGVPETTRTEASLRVDRISGARLVQTVPGKLLGYGTIELEAPGEHPGVRRLVRIDNPDEFYLHLREVMFGEPPSGPAGRPQQGDPDDGAFQLPDYVTERLPSVEPPDAHRFRRHP